MAEVTRKPQFVEQLAEKLGVSKKEAEPFVDAYQEVLQDNLVKGNSVQFLGHGTYEVRERSARKGRNPKTGEEIQISASKYVAFKAGKSLADVVSGKAEIKSKVAKKEAKKEVKAEAKAEAKTTAKKASKGKNKKKKK